MTKITIMEKELKIVTETINSDRELFYSYQSNIAMAFVDSCANLKKKSNKKYLNSQDIHKAANEAAINFLNLWIKP